MPSIIPKHLYWILFILLLFVVGEIGYIVVRGGGWPGPTNNTTPAAENQTPSEALPPSPAVPAARAEGEDILFIENIQGTAPFLFANVRYAEYFANSDESDAGARAAYEDGLCSLEQYERGLCLTTSYYFREAATGTTTVPVSPDFEVWLVDTPGAYYPEGKAMDVTTFRTLFRRSDYGDITRVPFHFDMVDGVLTKIFEQYIP